MNKMNTQEMQIEKLNISTITASVYTNIENILIEKIPNPFQDESCKISEKKNRFKNCIIFKVNFDTDNKIRNIAVNVFKNGMFHVTGSSRVEEIEMVIEYFVNKFKELDILCGFSEELVMNVRIRMIMSNFSIKERNLNLNILKDSLERDFTNDIITKYDTYVHPGLIVKFRVDDDNYITFIFFGTGKILITGAKSLDTLNLYYEKLSQYISNNGCSFSEIKQHVEKIKLKRGRKRKHTSE